MKSIELPQVNATDSCSQSVCEACGEQFSCGASSSGCWCVEVKVTEDMRAGLRERYKSCLCRNCLERAARGEELQQPEKIFG